MKKLTGIFCLAIILFSCGPKDTYKVKGTVSDVDLNGQSIFLILYDNEGPVTSDSVEIRDNKFLFTGKITIPTVYYLMMDYTPSYEGEITQGIPVFIEPRTITVDIIGNNLKIGGNKDNETYQKVLDKQFKMIADIKALTSEYEIRIQEDSSAIETGKELFIKTEAISNEYKDILLDYLKNNIHSQMGQEVFRNNYYLFTPDEIEIILDNAPDDFKSQSDIREFLVLEKIFK